MSTVMHKRIRKIEAVVLPPPPPPPVIVKLLGEPPPDATPAVLQAFNDKLQALRAAGHQVILLRALRGQPAPGGVESYDTEAEALLAVAARSPSTAGNRSQLDDVLQGLAGNVITPRAAPTAACRALSP